MAYRIAMQTVSSYFKTKRTRKKGKGIRLSSFFPLLCLQKGLYTRNDPYGKGVVFPYLLNIFMQTYSLLFFFLKHLKPVIGYSITT